MSNNNLNPALNNLVMPENLKTLTRVANSNADGIQYKSTVQVDPSPEFNSESIASATQAQAFMNSEHLNLLATIPGVGFDPLNQMRSDTAPQAQQLRTLRLPDTRVNINNPDGTQQKIEISYQIKQYANDIDQEEYLKQMMVLLKRDRMIMINKGCTKSNQATKPALWLNQHICAETKDNNVFVLQETISPVLKNFRVDPEIDQQVLEIMSGCMGQELHGSIAHIARATHLSPYVVLVALVDRIISKFNWQSVPVTSLSIWDSILRDPEAKTDEAVLSEALTGEESSASY